MALPFAPHIFEFQNLDRLSLKKMKGLMADPGSLRQILVNLMLNAADSIHAKKGEIDLKASLIDGMVELSIRDSGKGISAEDRMRLFDPFFLYQSTR